MRKRPIKGKPVRPQVTDHCLLRMLDRSGFEVERVRSAIADALAAAHGAAVALGGSDHLIKVNGLTFVVRGSRVVTVLRAAGDHDRGQALDPRTAR